MLLIFNKLFLNGNNIKHSFFTPYKCKLLEISYNLCKEDKKYETILLEDINSLESALSKYM